MGMNFNMILYVDPNKEKGCRFLGIETITLDDLTTEPAFEIYNCIFDFAESLIFSLLFADTRKHIKLYALFTLTSDK